MMQEIKLCLKQMGKAIKKIKKLHRLLLIMLKNNYRKAIGRMTIQVIIKMILKINKKNLV